MNNLLNPPYQGPLASPPPDAASPAPPYGQPDYAPRQPVQYRTVYQTYELVEQKVVSLKRRFLAPLIALRIPLIALLTGGWIAAICAPRDAGLFNGADTNTTLNSTTMLKPLAIRYAYIVIGAVATFVSLLILLFNLVNCCAAKRNSSAPWMSSFGCLDAFFMSGVTPISILAGILESQIAQSPAKDEYYNNVYRKGTMAAASAFGLGSTVLYAANIIYELIFAGSLRSVKKNKMQDPKPPRQKKNQPQEDPYAYYPNEQYYPNYAPSYGPYPVNYPYY